MFVDHGAVGLVSFPGSGNTSVRHLLQLATGICTGEWEKNGLCTYSIYTCTIASSRAITYEEYLGGTFF